MTDNKSGQLAKDVRVAWHALRGAKTKMWHEWFTHYEEVKGKYLDAIEAIRQREKIGKRRATLKARLENPELYAEWQDLCRWRLGRQTVK